MAVENFSSSSKHYDGVMRMNYLKTEFLSTSLGHQVCVDILVPEGPPPEGGWPILYLLHGYSEGNSLLMRYTQIEHMVKWDVNVPLVVVMPGASNSFYTDSPYGNYWTYISKELPERVEALLHISSRRENQFVAGFSMGGFGALKTAFHFPDRFGGVFSISGAVGDFFDTPEVNGVDALAGRRELFFGKREDFDGSANDLKSLALRMNAAEGPNPELVLYCGKNDFLIEANRSFHAYLEENDIKHRYVENEGTHSHTYANQQLLDILQTIKSRIESEKLPNQKSGIFI
ncbi:alpha/beta hydrolase [Bacillus sp. USDA818B3_A]|uniref:alpha/beta hydrolase n=1 Tax=Bacillus sp. USDA818B3_A TaxID=2698834 RepID=UPI001369C069|nr:alpha/beta hydrolase family protein [Bacillus sp. USDA818B3_A]